MSSEYQSPSVSSLYLSENEGVPQLGAISVVSGQSISINIAPLIAPLPPMITSSANAQVAVIAAAAAAVGVAGE